MREEFINKNDWVYVPSFSTKPLKVIDVLLTGERIIDGFPSATNVNGLLFGQTKTHAPRLAFNAESWMPVNPHPVLKQRQDKYALASEQERVRLDSALNTYKSFIASNLNLVKSQYEQSKHLSRKDYAVTGKSFFDSEESTRVLFSPYMSLYIDYDEDKLYDDLKNIFIKNVDAFAL